jgi:hypothetical protein
MTRPSTPVGPPIDPLLDFTPPTPQPQLQMSYAPNSSGRATHSYGTSTPTSLPPRHMAPRPMPSTYPRQDEMDLQNGGLDVRCVQWAGSSILFTYCFLARRFFTLFLAGLVLVSISLKPSRTTGLQQWRKDASATLQSGQHNLFFGHLQARSQSPKASTAATIIPLLYLGLASHSGVQQWFVTHYSNSCFLLTLLQTFAREACIAARLNLTVGTDGQNVQNLATAYKMVSHLVSRLLRCSYLFSL